MNDTNLADALMDDYRTAPIESEMKQLLSFVEKVARDAGRITADDVERIRLAGFTDRAILDAAHVAGFFSYMNRMVQALGADGKARVAGRAERENSSAVSSRAVPMQI